MADEPPPPPGEKKSFDMGGIFSAKPKAQAFDMSEVVSEVTNVSRRLRIVEERYTNFRRKVTVIEQNMITNHKKLSGEIKMVSSEIEEIKNILHEIENKMLLMVKELRTCAKKEEVQVIQKYLNYWEPLNFVTQKQLNDALKGKDESPPKVDFPQNL